MHEMTPSGASPLFQGLSRASQYDIRCLVPDLPALEELLPYLMRIDQNEWYTNFGPLTLEYEARLGKLSGTDALGGECVTLSSGTAALELGIAALDLPEGSGVLLPAFTFPATLLAVLRCGLKPVLSDVSDDTWTLTPEMALQVMHHHPCKLVLPVATFGCPLPSAEWDRFSQTTGVNVLIDAAAALGQQQVGRSTNVAYSLHATKPLGIGEGGVFATADKQLAERIRRMSNFGFEHELIKYPRSTNAKLSEYASAVGLAQLDRWPDIFRRRCSLWERYWSALSKFSGVRVQSGLENKPPAVVSVRLKQDASLIASKLKESRIETRRWYLPPLHQHDIFSDLERRGPLGGESLPVTESISRHNLGLPFHYRLSDQNVKTIVAALEECMVG